MQLKRWFKQRTHNGFFKALAGFGRAMNRLYENRNYDPHSNGEQVLLRKLGAFDPQVIIDGGANVGHYARALAQVCPQARVFAFEPVQETFAQLQANLTDLSQVQPVNLGLFSQNERREILLYESHTHSSLYALKGVGYQSRSRTEIDLVRGDEWLARQGITQVDLLKLDLEGAEYDALQGFEASLAQGRIRLIQFEYGYINITTKRLLVDFYELLEGHGYRVGKVFPQTVEFRPYHFKYEDFIGPNFVALRQDDEELQERLLRP
jgi:FkbM family methyltransferase